MITYDDAHPATTPLHFDTPAMLAVHVWNLGYARFVGTQRVSCIAEAEAVMASDAYDTCHFGEVIHDGTVVAVVHRLKDRAWTTYPTRPVAWEADPYIPEPKVLTTTP